MNENIGSKLKTLRKSKKLTQQDVADKLDISRATLSNIDLKLFQLESAAHTAITPDAVEKYLNDMLLQVNTSDEHIIKALFDKLIDKIVVDVDTITVSLVVSPYPRIGDKRPKGQPQYKLCSETSRKNLTR